MRKLILIGLTLGGLTLVPSASNAATLVQYGYYNRAYGCDWRCRRHLEWERHQRWEWRHRHYDRPYYRGYYRGY